MARRYALKINWRKFVNTFGKIASPIVIIAVIFLSLAPPKQGVALFPHFDKVAHFIAYAAIAGSLFLAQVFYNEEVGFKAIFRKNRKPFLSSFLIATFIGIIVEFVQIRFNRACEFLDMVSDSLGALFGIVVAIFVVAIVASYDKQKGKNE